jgi:hypothetical protein
MSGQLFFQILYLIENAYDYESRAFHDALEADVWIIRASPAED